MKKMSPKKKVTWIINSVMTLSAIALVVIVHYIKAKYNLPTLVLYACSMPVQIGGFILFSKWLENSKWKDTVEEMEKEAEEEEEPTKPKHIPGSFGLILLAIICLGFSIDNGIDLTAGIFSNAYEPEQFLKVIVPDCIGVFTINKGYCINHLIFNTRVVWKCRFSCYGYLSTFIYTNCKVNSTRFATIHIRPI
jgi:hypothetical protein